MPAAGHELQPKPRRAPTAASGAARQAGRAALWSLVALVAMPALAAHPPLPGANVFLGRVCTEQGGQFYDVTEEARSDGGGDLSLGDDASNNGANAVYWGAEHVFAKLLVRLSNSGNAGTVSWWYWGGMWKPLNVQDETQSFTASAGTYSVSFDPPGDWAPTEVNASDCPGNRHYVQHRTETNYVTLPLAEMVHGLQYNLRLQVVGELENPHASMGANQFLVSGGTENDVLKLRTTQTGVYELALRTGTADPDYLVQAAPPGFVRTPTLATGTLTSQLTDLTNEPLRLLFSLKVVVKDREGVPITDAVVRHGGEAPVTQRDGAYYFARTTSGSLSFEREGYMPLDLAVDRALADVTPGADAQTLVTLAGNTACNATSAVGAGQSVVCRAPPPDPGPNQAGAPGSPSSDPATRAPGKDDPSLEGAGDGEGGNAPPATGKPAAPQSWLEKTARALARNPLGLVLLVIFALVGGVGTALALKRLHSPKR